MEVRLENLKVKEMMGVAMVIEVIAMLVARVVVVVALVIE